MNIPQMFTRTSFCEHCANNGLPYISSEQIKHHKLRFFVKKNGGHDPHQFEPRKQSKAGKLGYTPHLFVIENTQIGVGGKKMFHGFKVCCIENCGLTVTAETINSVSFTLEKIIKCTWYEEELLQLFNYHDETFMLDTKEMQPYVEPGIVTELDPN